MLKEEIKNMAKVFNKAIASVVIIILLLTFIPSYLNAENSGKENKVINGILYTTEPSPKSKGEYSYNVEGSEFKQKSLSEAAGALFLSGSSVKEKGENVFEVDTREVQEPVRIIYSLNNYGIEELDKGWYISSENEKKINDVTLDNKVKTGAFIVEMSRDGETWTVLKSRTDIFNEESDEIDCSYEIQPIQMQNGTYFRISVAYQLKKLETTSKLFLGFGSKKTFAYTKNVEVYEFFISDSNIVPKASPENTPRKEFRNIVKIKKDKGYAISEKIDFDKNDPQYSESSKLGYFVINGYSGSPDENNGVTTFTKNAGDDITLWFCFNDSILSIDDLFGDGKVSLSSDKKAFDKDLGIEQMDFGYGALFVRYTNTEGTPRTVSYFDFLKAVASPAADTKVQLYEEGTYEVILDYELKNGLTTYTNYKMSFQFEIKNGNCMIFFREGKDEVDKQGSELANMARANDGFYVDFAGSKDLEVTFQRSTLIPAGNNTFKEDVRENKGVNDKDSFTKEGIYTFTIHNKHIDQKVYKTIIIGEEKAYKALSKNALTVKELNNLITAGYKISEDGTMIEPQQNGKTGA